MKLKMLLEKVCLYLTFSYANTIAISYKIELFSYKCLLEQSQLIHFIYMLY